MEFISGWLASGGGVAEAIIIGIVIFIIAVGLKTFFGVE